MTEPCQRDIEMAREVVLSEIHSNHPEDLISAIACALAAERERCARIAEKWDNGIESDPSNGIVQGIAEEIRGSLRLGDDEQSAKPACACVGPGEVVIGEHGKWCPLYQATG